MHLVFALVCGLLMGLGLTLSGMTDPAKVLAFLDIGGQWDPSLVLVFAAAIGVTAPLLQTPEAPGENDHPWRPVAMAHCLEDRHPASVRRGDLRTGLGAGGPEPCHGRADRLPGL
ncbi:putative transmembrane protein [Bordetella holmesii 35009]|nr:putative transmembrane protein [Bordetella holmesii 35009]SUV90365.1 Predicted transporter component [Bordetella holmesii]